MKKTLKYYLKNRLNIILILSFFVFLIVFVSLFNVDFVYRYNYYDEMDKLIYNVSIQNSPLPLLATITSVLSTFVVVFEFYFKMRKVNVDQIYSLPIKREKIFLSKLIVCALEVVVPMTVGFVVSYLMIFNEEHLFNLIYFIPYYFGLLFLALILIVSFAFIYTRGNTFFDGIVNMVAYSFMIVIIVSLITETFDISYYKFGNATSFFIYSPISIFSSWMDDLFSGREYVFKLSSMLSFIIYILFGLLSFYLFIILNKKEPSENSTQISESDFSYKTIIPILSIPFSAISILSGGFLALAFSSIFTYLAFVLYKRSFKLSKKDYVFIAIYITIGIVVGICCKEISDVYNEVYIEKIFHLLT